MLSDMLCMPLNMPSDWPLDLPLITPGLSESWTLAVGEAESSSGLCLARPSSWLLLNRRVKVLNVRLEAPCRSARNHSTHGCDKPGDALLSLSQCCWPLPMQAATYAVWCTTHPERATLQITLESVCMWQKLFSAPPEHPQPTLLFHVKEQAAASQPGLSQPASQPGWAKLARSCPYAALASCAYASAAQPFPCRC